MRDREHPLVRSIIRTPLLLAAMTALVALDERGGLLGRIFRRPVRPPRRTHGPYSAARRLGEFVVGQSRRAVLRLLGPPRTVMLAEREGKVAPSVPEYWQAHTWYYALSPHHPWAMAVRFDGDRARRVEFIALPETKI